MPSKVRTSGTASHYGLVLVLVGVTVALVLAHGGRYLEFGFPVMATIVAAILAINRRDIYVAFVWWIWLFTPLVRRLVDYQSSYHNVSVVLLTPLLVTGISAVSIMLRPRVLLLRTMVPFLLLLFGVGNAFVVGFFTNGALPAAYDMLSWVTPMAFGVFLMIYPDEYLEMRKSLIFAIISGAVVISAYGIYQFFHITPWDAFWLDNAQIGSAGKAVALGVRVFGTLNAPQAYADALLTSLVFAILSKGRLRIAAGALAITAFGLSLVRSAWLGFALAILYMIFRMNGSARIRFAAICLILATIVLPIVEGGPIADRIADRFSTLGNIEQDSSFRAREELYSEGTLIAIGQPLGQGFGIAFAGKLATGSGINLDSGLLQIPLEFGWVGSGLLVWAMAALLIRSIRHIRDSHDKIAVGGTSLFIAMLGQNIFISTFGGVLGVCLWVGYALAVGPIVVTKVQQIQGKNIFLVRPVKVL